MSRKQIHEIQYQPTLDVFQTQEAIKFIKDDFQQRLSKKLHLLRVSAPLFVREDSGLNDGLNGVERPISFDIHGVGSDVEIVHSLAKWKRMALGKYNIAYREGLYTDMNAIRKDETLDFIHSCYVDQWDWEVSIQEKDRTLAYLKSTVRSIYAAILGVARAVENRYPELVCPLPSKITFVSTRQAEKRYPDLSRKEREDALTREYGAVFLYQIGGKLRDGKPHDGRAADYDDWNLNGDILVHYPLYDMALELSSMGIRVNKERLRIQLAEKGELDKLDNAYCKAILSDTIPQSIGGGIGQSRLSMFLLQKAHIGEVQVSVWDDQQLEELKTLGIALL